MPPAAPTDPNHHEKQKLEAVRLELTQALDRVNDVLKTGPRPANKAGVSAKKDTSAISVTVE